MGQVWSAGVFCLTVLLHQCFKGNSTDTGGYLVETYPWTLNRTKKTVRAELLIWHTKVFERGLSLYSSLKKCDAFTWKKLTLTVRSRWPVGVE